MSTWSVRFFGEYVFLGVFFFFFGMHGGVWFREFERGWVHTYLEFEFVEVSCTPP